MKNKRNIVNAVMVLLALALVTGILNYQKSDSGDEQTILDSIMMADEAQIRQMSTVFSDRNEAADSMASSNKAVGMEELPKSYFGGGFENTANKRGTLEEVTYERILTSESGDAMYSTAVVYLPYGYDESRKYDVLYLMHGMGGTQYTFLGNAVMEGGIKVMLDNMIEEGKIRPIVVVAPGLEESKDVDLDNEVICELNDSIIQNLIPLVESKYSTYAQSSSEEDLIASRDHRCYGGFSMGGCSAWQMLWHYTEYFRYYIPNSMIADFRIDADVESTTLQMAEEISSKGYTCDDFEIYCAAGTEDYTNFMVTKQIAALNDYPELFKSTGDKGFDKGNYMYRLWSGRYHRFYESFPYFYNALQLFFGADDEA